jgi:competence protein ComEC
MSATARSASSSVGRIRSGVSAALAEQILRWPLCLPLALVFGAAAYMTSPVEPGWALLVALAALPAIAAVVLRTRPGMMGLMVCACLAAGGIGALAAKIRTVAMAAPVLAERTGAVRIEGVIAEIDASDSGRRLRLAVRAIERMPLEMTLRFVRFTYKHDIPWLPGQAVACRAILSPPPAPSVPGDYAFRRDAYFQQLGGVGFAVGECQSLPNPPPRTLVDRAADWIAALRRDIAEFVEQAAGSGSGGAMTAAMTVGDRSFISPEDSEALRASGLAHLISISGLHMVLAGGAFFFAIRIVWPLVEPLALRVPTVHGAAACAMIGCTVYFLISGGEVATQRAYIIAMIGFSAKLFDKPALSLRSLAVSMTLVVLIQPESVVSPGFQMSFAASAALIALYEMWPRLDRPVAPGVIARAGGWLLGASATSLVASLATLPFAIHHFARVAPLSILANLATSPVITFWTTPSAIAAAVATPLGLQQPFLWLTGRSLDVVGWIAHETAARSPDPTVPALDPVALAASVLAIGLFCVLRGWLRLVALIPAAVALGAWLMEPLPAGYISTDGSVFLRTDEGWAEVTTWRGENGLNPLVLRSKPLRACRVRKGQPPEPCMIETASGRFMIGPAADAAASPAQPAPSSCPSSWRLTYQSVAGGPPLSINPCDIAGKGGGVLELTPTYSRVRTSVVEQRPWSPPRA